MLRNLVFVLLCLSIPFRMPAAAEQPDSVRPTDPVAEEGSKHIAIHAEHEISTHVTGNEIVASVPCEGCEAVFAGLPSALSSSARIAPATEPGEPLRFTGIVSDQAGNPQPGVVVYAYQTDSNGHYPNDPRLSRDATRHGRLRAWTITEVSGRYAFDTIRPGAYPGRTTPEHIHMHVIEPGRCTYYIGDLMFTDDPRLTGKIRNGETNAIGGSGIVQAEGDAQVGWQATRDIVLGLNLPTYGKCQRRDR